MVPLIWRVLKEPVYAMCMPLVRIVFMLRAVPKLIDTTTDITGTTAKYLHLRSELRQRLLDGGLVIAFSGGVDSAFLLWAAEQERLANGGELLALTTSSASL